MKCFDIVHDGIARHRHFKSGVTTEFRGHADVEFTIVIGVHLYTLTVTDERISFVRADEEEE